MRYQGPIYRPPSESDSLLVQATVGCPHNKCTFCMVYKQGPPYAVRPVADILADLTEARRTFGPGVRTLFLPAGNTIAMPTDQLEAVCRYARQAFPGLTRVTVYGSSQYIKAKGAAELKRLRASGLSRIHVGFETGDDEVLGRVKKGCCAADHVEAGLMLREAGIELNVYVLLGIGGRERSRAHALATAAVLNEVGPDVVRLRTFVPKIDTLLLHQIKRGRFQMLTPHEVLQETRLILEHLRVNPLVTSDHYTNYINLEGRLQAGRARLLRKLDAALSREESTFRPFFIGTQ